mgnify:CR=1 FL=1
MQEPISTFKISLAIASMLWGAASLRYLRPNATPTERYMAFFISACGTYYTTPVLQSTIEHYAWLQAGGMEAVIGFTLGIFYVQIIDIAQHFIAHYRKDPKQALADLMLLKK